ncbi:hypothetical protein EV421DRAFT_1910270 [Armillaria borealis]|uniref:Uncharacterized protein n=1 Tax=Armillaria borealis TaxID=47425 RepID=A0AA39MH45_9AGAR|nr:hypothetical protein EV421DRAFT_1910270 [Armillaria borealis]
MTSVDSASLEELKALISLCLDRLERLVIDPALPSTALGDSNATATATALVPVTDGGAQQLEGFVTPPGAHTTVPLEPLVASSEARPESAHAPMFNCQICGAVNNPPPHEPYPYYAITKGLAVGVVCGVSNVLPLTLRVSSSLFTKGPGEEAAVTQFNEALALGTVKVLAPSPK